MSKLLGSEYAEGIERKNYIMNNCESAEEIGYMKSFSPEEIQKMKDELAETSIIINDIDVESKDVAKMFKEQKKPYTESKKLLLKGIKEKATFVREECYKFIDEGSRVVEFYNSKGELVESRTATAAEMQKSVFHEIRKTGTDN